MSAYRAKQSLSLQRKALQKGIQLPPTLLRAKSDIDSTRAQITPLERGDRQATGDLRVGVLIDYRCLALCVVAHAFILPSSSLLF
jgi:hypothetical protein